MTKDRQPTADDAMVRVRILEICLVIAVFVLAFLIGWHR